MKNSSSIILILISVGLFYTFISPQYQKTGALRAEADEYKGVIDNVNMLVETRDRLMDQYRDFPKLEVERLNKILPDDVDMVRLAKDLDSIASAQGISISRISVEADKDDDARAIIESGVSTHEDSMVSFEFISTYESFKRFMADLEDSLRISDIESVSFEVGESNLYEYRVSMRTYWLK